jgi:hypothetical protein
MGERFLNVLSRPAGMDEERFLKYEGFRNRVVVEEFVMAKRSKKGQKSHANPEGYVVVAFAEDMEQATEYQSLLQANDISATITEHDENAIGSKEIAVMVPEEFLDEAHVIIESQHAYDDFYDFALESDDEGDFDDDFIEDEF